MQEPEEAAAIAEAQRLRVLWFVDQRRVVETEFCQRVPQVSVLLAVGRKQAGKDHRLDVDIAIERNRGGIRGHREGVADFDLGNVLDARDDVAHLACSKRLGRRHLRGHHPHFFDHLRLLGRHRLQ